MDTDTNNVMQTSLEGDDATAIAIINNSTSVNISTNDVIWMN